MRTRIVTHLLNCLVLAFNGAAQVSLAYGAEVPSPGMARRAPIVEVVAFGVAPVAGVPEHAQLRLRDTDILHRIDAFGTRSTADGDVENAPWPEGGPTCLRARAGS
jgi:hypothetical protein